MLHRQPGAHGNGRELILYAVHLSAYTSDGTIAIKQMEMLLDDMQAEYEKGNYCVCGGDFNKDLLGNSDQVFGISAGDYTWAQPVPAELFSGKNIAKIAPLDRITPSPAAATPTVPITRDSNVLTVDGFMVTPNVTVQATPPCWTRASPTPTTTR